MSRSDSSDDGPVRPPGPRQSVRKAPRKPRGGRGRGGRRPLRWLLGALLLLGVLGAAGLAATLFFVARDPTLPRIDTVRDYRPPQVVRVLDRSGETLGEIFQERRTVVPLDRMPKILVAAVVAAEDADFFRHRGLDYMGMLRAFLANLRAGRFVQGGSTITQQVVKTFFLSRERTLRRKLQEVILARRLEAALSKDEILWLYLNQIYFGHGRYGVEEASRFLFGKPAAGIGLAEASLLAGLPQGPEALSPLRHPDRARQRQSYVLDRLVAGGAITAAQAAAVKAAPLPLAAARDDDAVGTAPEIVDVVSSRLRKRFGDDAARIGGSVTTTIDARDERAARAALHAGLGALDKRQGFDKPLSRLSGKALARHLASLKSAHGPTFEAVVASVDDAAGAIDLDLGARHATLDLSREPRIALGGKKPSSRFAPGDVVPVRDAPERGPGQVAHVAPEGALVAIDPQSGEVRALVGGDDFRAGGFDRALVARRQPGSAFKPFLYAAGIESAKFTAASVRQDSPEVMEKWAPKNYETDTWRGPVRLRIALAESINSVAVKLIQETGVPPVLAMARRLGIASPLGEDLSISLGTSPVTPLELTSAYATFAAEGARREPRLIREWSLFGGADAPQTEREPDGAAATPLSPDLAYVMTDMLTSVIREGTGRAALKLGRPAAGKTGTTNDHKDAWFIGYTPDLCAGVWVGFDEPRPLGKGEAGGRTATPIWTEFMTAALRGTPVHTFRQPAGVVVARIDPRTGLRAPADMADAVDEVFLAGTEPQEVAPAATEVDPDSFLLEQLGHR